MLKNNIVSSDREINVNPDMNIGANNIYQQNPQHVKSVRHNITRKIERDRFKNQHAIAEILDQTGVARNVDSKRTVNRQVQQRSPERVATTYEERHLTNCDARAMSDRVRADRYSQKYDDYNNGNGSFDAMDERSKQYTQQFRNQNKPIVDDDRQNALPFFPSRRGRQFGRGRFHNINGYGPKYFDSHYETPQTDEDRQVDRRFVKPHNGSNHTFDHYEPNRDEKPKTYDNTTKKDRRFKPYDGCEHTFDHYEPKYDKKETKPSEPKRKRRCDKNDNGPNKKQKPTQNVDPDMSIRQIDEHYEECEIYDSDGRLISKGVEH